MSKNVKIILIVSIAIIIIGVCIWIDKKNEKITPVSGNSKGTVKPKSIVSVTKK